MTEIQGPQKREKVSTYVVQDRQNKTELQRLTIQDQLLTSSMGGALPEQPHAEQLRRILDIGCGTGGWAIEAAKTYPKLSVVGIDISQAMIEYAQLRADEEGVGERVEFRVMDAMQYLEFRKHAFDLVNMRFSLSWMRTWNWPKMLNDIQRVTRPGGVIRLTESDIIDSNGPMLTRWMALALHVFHQAGYFFEQKPDGLTSHLALLLRRYSAVQVQTKAYSLEYRGNTPEGELFCEDWSRGMKTHRPFFQKWIRLPADYDEMCEQATREMQQSDFRATWNLLTAWGTKPL